jgi:hypothetical protein
VDFAEFKTRMNETLQSLRSPYLLKEGNEKNTLICEACSIIADKEYTLIASKPLPWIVLIIATMVDIVTGVRQGKRNKVLKVVGLYDGSFVKGKEYPITGSWKLKASYIPKMGLMFQILRRSPL